MTEPTRAAPAKLEVYTVSALPWLEALTIAACATGRRHLLVDIGGEKPRIIDAHQYMELTEAFGHEWDDAKLLALADPPSP